MKDSYMNVVVSQLGKSTDNVSIHTKDSPKCTDDSFSKTIEKSTVKLAEKDSYDRQEPVSEELDASKTEVVYEDDGQVYEEEPKVEETEEYAQNLTVLIPKKEAVDVACEFANEQKGMFQEAGQQMQTAICEQLNISEEEFEQVMEELGITVFELFNPAQLAEFVMKVSGIEDAGQLLVTSDFVQLKHQVEGIQNELVEKTGLVEAMNQPKKVDKNEVRDFILKTASYLEQPEQMVEPEVNVHPQAQSSEEQNGQMTAEEKDAICPFCSRLYMNFPYCSVSFVSAESSDSCESRYSFNDAKSVSNGLTPSRIICSVLPGVICESNSLTVWSASLTRAIASAVTSI